MTPLLAQRPRSDRAFERMYRRHVGDVYRYALAVMRNPADAEDVTQTTFMNAYRSYLEKGKRPEKPQSWLIGIAHGVCRQRCRQSARRSSEVAFADDIAVSDPDAVETLIFCAQHALREQLEGALTCGEAEFAISLQLDGRLPRRERAQLRAHLRVCLECAAFARRQRAQRGALKALGVVSLPSSLASFFGGAGVDGRGVAFKAVAVVSARFVVGSTGGEGLRRVPWHPSTSQTAAPPHAELVRAAEHAIHEDVPSSPAPG